METNIRVYNETENKWHMRWIDTINYKLLSFTATEKNGVLTIEGYNAQGRPKRNEFSNVAKNSFDGHSNALLMKVKHGIMKNHSNLELEI